MRKLALSDEILMKIDKPVRYIGHELNSVVKNPEDVDIRFAMCFPDVYEIGMSHLGIQILYDMFNRREDVYCERVYSPWPDLHQIMKEQHIPLFGLESQEPLTHFDFIGITIQYEMCYTNILQILDLAQIPLLAKERERDMPFVIGGGPCTYNPEPLADFFDLFYIGEGETSYDALLDLYKDWKKSDESREVFLHQAAKIPGIYVPALYEVSYKENGTLSSMEPVYDDIPRKIEKQVVTELTASVYPDKPVVPFLKVTQDRVVLEVQRGCIRGCRFCQAGMIYRPLREKDVERLKRQADIMLANTGYEEISLSSLSTSDYRELEDLINYLIEHHGKEHVNISLPSLRVDAFSLEVMGKVQDIKKSSLTFAPEAGSQRLRDVINKGLTEDIILHGCGLAFEGGWNKVKLYFMLGLPGETYDDIEGIAILSDKIAREYYTIPKDERNGKVSIVTSTSIFVPKPFTPFQWSPMNTKEQAKDKRNFLLGKVREQLNQKSIKYNCHDADVSELEGVFARGDRRLNKVILEAYQSGCFYDAWSEYFKYENWLKAFEDNGLDMAFYIGRERPEDELFPWDFIDIGVTKKFMRREYENSLKAQVTPNCRVKCAGCGAMKFKCGVCVENLTGSDAERNG